MIPRFTTHTYSGYWWICDNLTNSAVVNKAGHRLFYHVNSYGLQKAAEMARRKVEKLNRELRELK